MRAYRTYYKDKDGKKKQVQKWYIETRDHLNIIRRFPALTDKRQSEAFGRQIDKLVRTKAAGEQPDMELAHWLEGIPDKLRSRFAKIGLLDPKRAAAGKLLSEHLEDFRQSMIAKNVTPQHIKQLSGHIALVFKGCKFLTWSDISASKIERFISDLRQKKGIGPQTANYYLKHTKQFCRWMVQDRRAGESPLEHLKTVDTSRDKRHNRRALEPDEIRRLLEATRAAPKRYGLTGYERALLYRLAIESGLRRGELRSLTVSSFDFTACRVTVEAAFSKNRKRSILPLRPDTIAEIKSFVSLRMPNTKIFNKITNRTSEMIQEDLADAKIPYVDESGRYLDFHSLRHTTGSLLAASGVHPKVAQSIMRHSDINLTLSRYTHIFRGQESEAVASLPDLSLPSKQSQKATGTDGKNLAQNLGSLSSKQRKPVNSNEQVSSGNSARVPITANCGGQKNTHFGLMG